jgi:hyaluronan synthase
VNILTILEPPTEVDVESIVSDSEECGQKFTDEGKIQVSKKAWAVRIITISTLAAITIYNLYQGLLLNDPLVAYSTIMPLHSFLVFTIGWLLFKNKSTGEPGNERVSVIIPVFNQEAMIEDVVDAVYESTYKNIEVIVVNDGSKDGTMDIVDSLAFKYPGLRVINKENGGKRTAVATGFYASKSKYIVLIDSDSLIGQNAIREFMKTLHNNPKIGGVVANCKVLNSDKNILTKCQDVWYDYAFNIHKTTESYFGDVLCCSGSLSCYRREAIAEFIPFWVEAKIQNSDDRDLTTYAMAPKWAKMEFAPIQKRMMESMARFDDAEDRGLTSITLTEWETAYVPSAVVHTEVPETMKKYLRQQVRWRKGYFRSSFYVSGFFWKKNPLMALIFYIEFMSTFTAPLIIFTIYLYSPLILKDYWLPITYLLSQILIGLAAGLDYKARDKDSKNWMYKPVMNMLTSFVLPWLSFPALLTYNKNRWLTR